MLFLAERFQHLEEVIKVHNKDKTILCDRYHDTTIAYQGGGREVDLKWLNSIQKEILQPDITFLFDMEVSKAAERISKRGESSTENNRFDSYDSDFHQRVREKYLHLFAENPFRIVRIDASRSIEQIHKDVIIQFRKRYK
jgi:dTMP kinase